MKTTFRDNYGETQSLLNKEIISRDDSTFTVQEGTLILQRYYSIDDIAEELDLNEKEIDLLMHDNGYVTKEGKLIWNG